MKISSLSYAAVAILLSCIPSTLVAAQESSVRGGSSGLPVAERMMEEAPVLLAEVDLGNNVKASFYKSVGDSIVLSTITPQEGEHHERLLRLLKEVGQDEEDPITLYGRLKGFASGGEDGSDTAPPEELVAAWETVQSHRAEQQSAADAAGVVLDVSNQELMELQEAHTHADESDVDPEDRHLLVNPWWTTNYCRDNGLVPSACLCYHYLTGYYTSSVTGATRIKFHVGSARGAVRQALTGKIGSRSYPISSQTVNYLKIGSIYTWAAYKYDKVQATVTYATGDLFHTSLYALSSSYGYNTCRVGY